MFSPEVDLLSEIMTCTNCTLHKSRNMAVPGTSILGNQLMIIGEAPGEEEDKQGLPFVGRSGHLLTESLCKIGLTREDVFITNIVKCRPPSNRDPSLEEVMACKSFLKRQIVLAKPKLIVALGRISAAHLLGRQVKITKEHGMIDVLPFNEDILVSIIYHPSYVLRNRNTKIEEDFIHDLREAKKIAYGSITDTEVYGRSAG